MGGLFRVDTPLLTTLGKIGDMFLLSLLWLLCSLPVITLLPASAALYYAVTKSVRHERDHAAKAFWYAFTRGLKQGMCLSTIFLIFSGVTYMWYVFSGAFPLSTMEGLVFTAISRTLLLIGALGVVFLAPLFSRFVMRTLGYYKSAYYLSLRHFGATLVVLVELLATLLLLFALPLFLIVLPAVFALLSSYTIEPIFARYTVDRVEKGLDTWYLE